MLFIFIETRKLLPAKISTFTVYEHLGFSHELPTKSLPTNGDILRATYHFREQGVTAKNPKLRNFPEVEQQLVDSIIALWMKASIPQIKSRQTITLRVKKLNENYIKVRKAIQSKNNPKLIEKFKGCIDKLFDICSCQCTIDVPPKEYRGKLLCSCPEDMRILFKEVSFLNDQRGLREQEISNTVDKSLSEKYSKSQQYLQQKVIPIFTSYTSKNHVKFNF